MKNTRATFLVYLFTTLGCCVVSLETKEGTEAYYDTNNCSCTTNTNSDGSDVTTSSTSVEENTEFNLTLKLATPCTTPNEDPGYCVEIQKCPILLEQLSNERAYKFVRQSRCGPLNEDPHYPKVCCGRYGNFRHLLARNPLPKRCGMQNVFFDTRIIGGEEADLGEFPWLAKVVHKNRMGYKSLGCSAFLIHAKNLLTAAHCIESDELKPLGPPFEVLLGEHDTDTDMDCTADRAFCSEPAQRIRIKDIVVHPRYNKSSRNHLNDIAIIHLRKAVRLSDFVQPICIDHKYSYEDAIEYWLSGWGTTETSQSSRIKMKVPVPKTSFQQCTQKYRTVRVEIKESQMCAGGTDKDSCTGDSGGPLMFQGNATHWYAAGIVSFGMGCAKPGWPGVYTNVTTFLPWVKSEILKRAQQPHLRRPSPRR